MRISLKIKKNRRNQMLHRVYGNSEEKNKISLGLMQEGKTRWINGKEPSERVRKHDKSLNN